MKLVLGLRAFLGTASPTSSHPGSPAALLHPVTAPCPPLRQSSPPGRPRGRRVAALVVGGWGEEGAGGGVCGSAAWEAGRSGREGQTPPCWKGLETAAAPPPCKPYCAKGGGFFRPERVAPCRRERSPSPQQRGEGAVTLDGGAAPRSLPSPSAASLQPPGRSFGAGRARARRPWARAPAESYPPSPQPREGEVRPGSAGAGRLRGRCPHLSSASTQGHRPASGPGATLPQSRLA